MKNTKNYKKILIGTLTATMLFTVTAQAVTLHYDPRSEITQNGVCRELSLSEELNINSKIENDTEDNKAFIKPDFIKYPWLINGIVKQNKHLDGYEYYYIISDLSISMDKYQFMNIEGKQYCRSMLDIMYLAKSPNGQKLGDIFGHADNIRDYAKYIVIPMIGVSSIDSITFTAYKMTYEPDESGNIKAVPVPVNFTATKKDILSLPSMF